MWGRREEEYCRLLVDGMRAINPISMGGRANPYFPLEIKSTFIRRHYSHSVSMFPNIPFRDYSLLIIHPELVLI